VRPFGILRKLVKTNSLRRKKNWCYMKMRYLPLMMAVALSFFVAGREAARGGSPASDGPVSGSAVVKGTVKFEGTAPKPLRINMAAEPGCAKLHPAGVSTEDTLTDAHGGLENVVVFVSEGLGDRTFDAPKQPAIIDQKGCMYEPHVIALRANQELDVLNNDTTTHNLHPVPSNNREWNKAQPPGTKVEVTFPREEIAIPMKCNVHPWMRGYIAVFKHPYFSVTGKGGNFELDNLPPGSYTIEAWHEKLGTSSQKITIGAGGTKEMEFVFKAQAGH
jgi:plastocyanin